MVLVDIGGGGGEVGSSPEATSPVTSPKAFSGGGFDGGDGGCMNRTPQSVQSVPNEHMTGMPPDSCTDPEPPSSQSPLLARVSPLYRHES